MPLPNHQTNPGAHRIKPVIALTILILAQSIRADPLLARIDQNALHYVGSITAAKNAALFEAYQTRIAGINWLIISSDGGEVNVSMDFGDWVFENQLNVKVIDRCFSSCANYVFAAAKIKVIENGALVAWYGSAVQSVQRSRREIEEVIDRDVLPGIPVNERAQQRSLLIHCVT